jgi:hypothetical protein
MKTVITYWDDLSEIEYNSEEVDIEGAGYFLGPAAYFEPVICDEDVDVVANKAVLIKIKEIQVPEDSILTLLGRFRHAAGLLLALGHSGKFERVEHAGKVNYAVFLPLVNGKILEGQLLGVGVIRKAIEKPRSVVVEKLKELDDVISIDPEVFVKSDWPYLWAKDKSRK